MVASIECMEYLEVSEELIKDTNSIALVKLAETRVLLQTLLVNEMKQMEL